MRYEGEDGMGGGWMAAHATHVATYKAHGARIAEGGERADDSQHCDVSFGTYV